MYIAYTITMYLQDWTDVLVGSLQNVWAQVASFLPSLIGAIIIFCVGLIIAAGIGALAEKVVKAMKVDGMLRRFGFEEYTKRANINLNSGHFVGQVVYWFLVLVFLLATSDILGFFALSNFINSIIAYIPNLVVAILMMLAALVIANIVRHLVRASIMGARLHSAKFLASAAWWVVVVLGLLAALTQLQIVVSNIVVIGLVAMFALAGGLAFGLGGREYAADILRRLRDELESK